MVGKNQLNKDQRIQYHRAFKTGNKSSNKTGGKEPAESEIGFQILDGESLEFRNGDRLRVRSN